MPENPSVAVDEEPLPRWHIEPMASDDERRLSWSLPAAEMRVEVVFADEPRSRLDLLPAGGARERALVATREAVTRRFADRWEAVEGWLAAHTERATPTPRFLRLVEHEAADRQAGGDGATATVTLTVEEFADVIALDTLIWRWLLPGLPTPLYDALAWLEPQAAADETAWLAHQYRWIWATHVGMHHEDVFDVAAMLAGANDSVRRPPTLHQWQLADFVAYWIDTYGAATFVCAARQSDVPDVAEWLTARAELALDGPPNEPGAAVVLAYDDGRWTDAFAACLDGARAADARRLRGPTLLAGYGRVAFLLGHKSFCHQWVSGRLAPDAYHRVAVRASAGQAPLLVPLQRIPPEAVAGAAFESAEVAGRVAEAMAEIGRVDLVLLVRAVRDLLDGPLADPTRTHRIEHWSQGSYGDADLGTFLQAWALQERGRSGDAEALIADLPEVYRLAWDMRTAHERAGD